MSSDVPDDAAVVETGDGVRYVLHRPWLDLARVVGVLVVGFGAVPVGMGVWFIGKMAQHFLPGHGAGALFGLIGLLCPLLFILCGGLLSLFGLWCLAGHSEIVVTADEISSAYRL